MPGGIRLTTAAERPAEREVLRQLEDLLSRHDLGRWQFTDEVVIEDSAIPHSHPVLTLGTFNRGPFLLASYLHEQLHWFVAAQMAIAERIYESELVRRYPEAPVGLPEGAATADSTYLHIFVCWYEVAALRELLPIAQADRVLEALIERGVYRWVYRVVRDDCAELGDLFRAGGLQSV